MGLAGAEQMCTLAMDDRGFAFAMVKPLHLSLAPGPGPHYTSAVHDAGLILAALIGNLRGHRVMLPAGNRSGGAP